MSKHSSRAYLPKAREIVFLLPPESTRRFSFVERGRNGKGDVFPSYECDFLLKTLLVEYVLTLR